jgi:predicted metal-dependent enzyme (double-stranded beta helix superfamily)
MNNVSRLRNFVQDFTRLVEQAGGKEERLLEEGGRLLEDLIKHDDWLPEESAQPHPEHYQQHLLYCDPFERFSVVSFVWGPGQKTPVHDHTVWGLIGVLRGAEHCRRFTLADAGKPMIAGGTQRAPVGTVECVSPTVGDVHEVANAYDDRVSISIHVYGANIGAVARHVYDEATGKEKDFVSGYASPTVPNLWDRSAEVREGLQA